MSITLSISAVERDTGLSKDTLRVWERRYGFPQPMRDAIGERLYPIEQVERLRLIKRLLDQGHRPGKIISLDQSALGALTDAPAKDEAAPGNCTEERADLLQYIALCKSYQFDEMRRAMAQDLLRLGLQRFVVDVIAPLNTMVGARWANGSFAVFEEHLYTESVQIVMRNAIASIPMQVQGGVQPRVLLTTFPQEQHGLGLLMAEAIFALEGARCISLGVQTPVSEIVRAAEAQRVDIVALSFSASMNSGQLAEGARDLRASLPGNIEIWAGGAAPGLYRRPPPELHVIDLSDIAEALAAWRAKQDRQAA